VDMEPEVAHHEVRKTPQWCRSEDPGPKSGCRTPPETEGDMGIAWIPEETGRHLQEGVPPCNSGIAQEAHHQKELNQVKGWASNPESRAAHEGSTVAPDRPKGNKESRRQATAIPEKEKYNHNRHRRVELGTAITSGRRTNVQDPQDNLGVGIREASKRDVQQVTE
jgi:hypothetical protein